MSLGSDTPTIFGAEENALLNAAAAGVFVANSAGNAGPGAGTVGSPSSVPSTTAVGADTLHRAFSSIVTITRPGETFTIKGASVTNALASTPLVDAANAAAAGATSAAAALCQDGTLDPAKVAGKVVLCLRGSNARINKSLNVMRAGGLGMILYDASDAQDLDTDTHWVPSSRRTRRRRRRRSTAAPARSTRTRRPTRASCSTSPTPTTCASSRRSRRSS
jgi:hypothetical protein